MRREPPKDKDGKPIKFEPPKDENGNPIDFSKLSRDPDDAGERVVRGIKRGDLFILTHVDFKPAWELRMNAILRAFPDEEPIPGFATTPALVVVGYMMLTSVVDIDWNDVGESLPAFITIAWMPFTYSISDGIMFGVIAYTAINAISGNFRRIHWIMYALTAIFVAKYALM